MESGWLIPVNLRREEAPSSDGKSCKPFVRKICRIEITCCHDGNPTNRRRNLSVTKGCGKGSPRPATSASTSGANFRSLTTCETRALDTPSLLASSAAQATSPVSKALCHSWARATGLRRWLAGRSLQGVELLCGRGSLKVAEKVLCVIQRREPVCGSPKLLGF
jgi:hypothetical protein